MFLSSSRLTRFGLIVAASLVIFAGCSDAESSSDEPTVGEQSAGEPAGAPSAETVSKSLTATNPVVSAEVELSAPIFDSPMAHETWPLISYDGTNYWVVYTIIDDARYKIDGEIRATRVTPSGQVLDPEGIKISQRSDIMPKALSCKQGQCLLVGEAQYKIKAVRFDATGQVLDPQPFEVAGALNDVAVANDGTNYLVVFDRQAAGTGDETVAVRIDDGGQLLDASPIVLTTPSSNCISPVVAFAQTHYQIAWQCLASAGDQISTRRLATDGTWMDPTPTVVAAASGVPYVASLDGESVVAWSDSNNGSSYFAKIVHPDGSVQAGPALDLGLSNGSLALGDDGTHFVAGNYLHSGALATRITKAGAVLDSPPLQIRAALPSAIPRVDYWLGASNGYPGPDMRISSGGSHALIVFLEPYTFVDGGNVDVDVVAHQLDSNGQLLEVDPFPVAGEQTHHLPPQVASNGQGYLAAWSEVRNKRAGGWDIYATRVDASGNPLDPQGIGLATGTGNEIEVQMASDGTDYLAVWYDDGADELRASRVSASSGDVLDDPALTVGGGFNQHPKFAVAYGAGVYLVVFVDATDQLKATRIAPDGTMVDAQPLTLQTAGPFGRTLALAFGAHRFLAVWEDGQSQSATVSATRISAEGAALDQPAISVASGLNYAAVDDVEFDGEEFVVTWHDRGASARHARAVRVDRQGQVLDATPADLGEIIANNARVGVADDGAGELAAWQATLASGGRGLMARPVSFAASSAPSFEAAVGFVSPDTVYHPLSLYVSDRQPSLASVGVGEFVMANLIADEDQVPRAVARTIHIDRPLTAVSTSPYTDEDTPLSLELEGHDPAGQSLQFSVTAPPAHGSLGGTAPQVVYTPDADYFGPDQFQFQVSNGQGNSDRAHVWITVGPVPDAPVAVRDDVQTDEDHPVDISVLGNDYDPDGEPIQYDGFTFDLAGTLTETAPGQFHYVPEQDFWGPIVFHYSISDPTGRTDVGEAVIHVNPVNDPPYFGFPTPDDHETYSVEVGEDVSLTMRAYDVDDLPGELDYGVDPLLPGMNIESFGLSRRVSWSPSSASVGEHRLTLWVEDRQGARAEREVIVQVEPRTPSPDAGTPDAGGPDAGSPDAASPDAGHGDAGTEDADSPDADSPDAAGRAADGGQAASEGCSCDTNNGAPPPAALWWMALGGMWLFALRRVGRGAGC